MQRIFNLFQIEYVLVIDSMSRISENELEGHISNKRKENQPFYLFENFIISLMIPSSLFFLSHFMFFLHEIICYHCEISNNLISFI